MSNKSFRFAGVSTRAGVIKVRFSDRANYVAALQKVGDLDIDLIELKVPMNKVDAVKYLISIEFSNGNAAVARVLKEFLDKRENIADQIVAPESVPA
jgi:hypothetical protein